MKTSPKFIGLAFLVGIPVYKSPNLTDFDAIANEIEELQKILKTFGYAHIFTISEEFTPVKQYITYQLSQFCNKVKGENETNQDDEITVLVYFAGHGFMQDQKYYFLPCNVRFTSFKPEKIDKTSMLADSAILSHLLKIPAKNLVVILNTCYSGGINTVGIFESIKDRIGHLGEKLLNQHATPESWAIISSARDSDKAYVEQGQEYTVFGTELIKNLNNGIINTGKLFLNIGRTLQEKPIHIGEGTTVFQKPRKVATKNLPLSGISLCDPAKIRKTSVITDNEDEKKKEKDRKYNMATIGKFLKKGYNGNQLLSICQAHFEDVFENITPGMEKLHIIREIIDYCRTRRKFPFLLEYFKKTRPDMYKEFEKDFFK